MPSSAAPTGERKPSIFLSSARADHEPFVDRLHDDLIYAGIDVWWDRAAMDSRGRTSLQEIRDAIEGLDRVVAVVAPAAISSQYVPYEWDHALLFAKVLSRFSDLGPMNCFRLNYWARTLRDSPR
jgi:TIR domain-containing protein